MIDLNKLQEKFDAFFEKETEASFMEWLEEKKINENFAYLGMGRVEHLCMEKQDEETEQSLVYTQEFEEVINNNSVGNIQYAMAA